MFSKLFLLDVVERAVKTFAQSLLVLFVGDSAYNVISVNWPQALGLAATAALVSILTSVVSGQFGDKNTASVFAAKQEQGTVDKIEAGEPVGDPAKVYEAAAVVAKPAVPAKKTPAKKVAKKVAPKKKPGV